MEYVVKIVEDSTLEHDVQRCELYYENVVYNKKLYVCPFVRMKNEDEKTGEQQKHCENKHNRHSQMRNG